MINIKIFYMNYIFSLFFRGLLLAITSIHCHAETQLNDQPLNLEETVSEASIHSNPEKLAYKNLEWDDLLPQDDLDALLNPPDYLSEIEDGSPEDQVTFKLQKPITDEAQKETADRFQQALVSVRVIEKLNGQAIKIPGFIVPLEYNDDQVITEFFLVPYFGACIHVPPPPPNQIIYVKYDKGFKLDALYDPFYISGILKTELINNDLGTSAYTMIAEMLEPYTE